MCQSKFERYLLAKVYLTKFNDCRALKLNNACLPKGTFHKLYYTYLNFLNNSIYFSRFEYIFNNNIIFETMYTSIITEYIKNTNKNNL